MNLLTELTNVLEDLEFDLEDMMYIHPYYDRKSTRGCHLIGIAKVYDKTEVFENLMLNKTYNFDQVYYELSCVNCRQSIFKFTLDEEVTLLDYQEITENMLTMN